MNFIIIFLTILFLLPINSFAKSGYYEGCYYETGDGISTSVSGKVSKEKDKGIFFYSYSVKSNPQSEQDVWYFRIILPQKGIIINATAPDGWGGPGWSGKPTKYGHLRQSELPPPYGIGWTAPRGRNMKPSEKASGFMFRTSFGLPGIVAYYAEGDAPLPKCEAEPEGNFIPGYHDLTPYGPGIVGRTIGPATLPATFKPIDFLNYIISLKHEAFKLGWIVQGRDDDKDKYEDEEEGIMKSLDKKLEKAKAELIKGDIRETIEKLKSFIHEVEALYKEGKEERHKKEEGHSHITSEAYALLKYNAVYLIEQLGGEWKDKNDKKD
jgi:hypothetical protein